MKKFLTFDKMTHCTHDNLFVLIIHTKQENSVVNESTEKLLRNHGKQLCEYIEVREYESLLIANSIGALHARTIHKT